MLKRFIVYLSLFALLMGTIGSLPTYVSAQDNSETTTETQTESSEETSDDDQSDESSDDDDQSDETSDDDDQSDETSDDDDQSDETSDDDDQSDETSDDDDQSDETSDDELSGEDQIRNELRTRFKRIVEKRIDGNSDGANLGERCGGADRVRCIAPLRCQKTSNEQEASGECVHPFIDSTEDVVFIRIGWGNFANARDDELHAHSSLVAQLDNIRLTEDNQSRNIGVEFESDVTVEPVRRRAGSGRVDADGNITDLVEFNGSIIIENAELKTVKPLLFEKGNDQYKGDRASQTIKINTKTGPHIDGLLIGINAADKDSANIKVEFNTIQAQARVSTLTEEPKIFAIADTDLELRMYLTSKAQVAKRLKNNEKFEELKELVTDRDQESCLEDFVENLDEAQVTTLKNAFNENPRALQRICKHYDQLDETFFENIASQKRQNLKKIIENKGEVLERVEELEDNLNKFSKLNTFSDLKEVHKRLQGYNFHGQSAQEARDQIIQFLENNENVTDEEIERFKYRMENVISRARTEKFTAGLLRFKDVDDDTTSWYYNYVENVAEKGIIKGYSDATGRSLGEFRPGNNVTYSEAAKMVLVAIFGEDISNGVPATAEVRDHWAAKYWKLIEDLDVDYNEFASTPDAAARRGDIIQLFVQASGIDAPKAAQRCFRDVAINDRRAAAICYAKQQLNIIAGDSGSEDSSGLSNFRPDASINRAETAKIVDNIIKLLNQAEESDTEIDTIIDAEVDAELLLD